MNICIADPSGAWLHSDAGYTGKGNGYDAWESLFHDVLQAPSFEVLRAEAEPGKDQWENDGNQKRLFQEDLIKKGYCMLSRIWDIYQDTCFMPDEIEGLLNECMIASEKAEPIKARELLNDLIDACRKALNTGSGIVLSSD